MQKHFVWIVPFLLLGLACAWWMFFTPLPSVYDPGGQTGFVPQKGALPSRVDEAMMMVARDIELSQGENGREIWRLKATQATIRTEGGNIEVKKPDIIYFNANGQDAVKVTANSGDVNQANREVHLEHDVRAAYGTEKLQSEALIYKAENKSMLFPSGVTFAGPNLYGRAARVFWELETQVLQADGGVNIDWESVQ